MAGRIITIFTQQVMLRKLTEDTEVYDLFSTQTTNSTSKQLYGISHDKAGSNYLMTTDYCASRLI